MSAYFFLSTGSAIMIILCDGPNYVLDGEINHTGTVQ